MEICLTLGQIAHVDEIDFNRISANKWRARWSKEMQSYYALRHMRVNGKTQTVYMHREVLGLVKGDGLKGDHIEPSETLDNRRSNLRITDYAGNGRNCRIPKHNTSGYKGVCWDKKAKKWRTQIRVNKKIVFLGFFGDPETAHKAYTAAGIRYHGEFARAY